MIDDMIALGSIVGLVCSALIVIPILTGLLLRHVARRYEVKPVVEDGMEYDD